MRTNPSFCARPGITLMEVLISIFVVSVGLLGVAALIPLAGHQTEQGSRNDRKANVGRRSFREFKVRGFHRPGRFDSTTLQQTWFANGKSNDNAAAADGDGVLWVDKMLGFGNQDQNIPPNVEPVLVWESDQAIDHNIGFCIDPVFMSHDVDGDGTDNDRVAALDVTQGEFFPHVPPPGVSGDPPVGLATRPGHGFAIGGHPADPTVGLPQLIRLTLSTSTSPTTRARLGDQHANELFVFRDDLNFQLPEGNAKNASQKMLAVDLNANGVIEAGENVKRDAAENYSWLATLFPRNGQWLLSTVVIRDRNLAVIDPGIAGYPGIPSFEITGTIDGTIQNPAVGTSGFYSVAGEVRVDWGAVTWPTTAQLGDGIPVGAWILIGEDSTGSFNWYRVTSTDELEIDGPTQHVFQNLVLSGPPLVITQATPTLEVANMIVGYIVGTEAVYQKTITLEL